MKVLSSVFVGGVDLKKRNHEYFLTITKPELRLGKVIVEVDGKSTTIEVFPHNWVG